MEYKLVKKSALVYHLKSKPVDANWVDPPPQPVGHDEGHQVSSSLFHTWKDPSVESAWQGLWAVSFLLWGRTLSRAFWCLTHTHRYASTTHLYMHTLVHQRGSFTLWSLLLILNTGTLPPFAFFPTLHFLFQSQKLNFSIFVSLDKVRTSPRPSVSFAQLLIAWLSPCLCLLAVYLPLNVMNFGH